MKAWSSVRYDDKSSWPPLDVLRTGSGGKRPPAVDDLRGLNIAASFSDGTTARYTFTDPSGIEFNIEQSGDKVLAGRAGCEVFAFDLEQYLVHVEPADGELTSLALVLDFRGHSVLAMESKLDASLDTRPAVSTRISSGGIDGGIPTFDATPTADLVGKRVVYDYGDNQVYEHIYLTPTLFTWVCLSGPEEGLADTESCMAYRLRRGAYLFCWQEKVVPCGASVLIDIERAQTCGAFLGRGADPGEILYFTWGARISSVDPTSYEPPWNPARSHRD